MTYSHIHKYDKKVSSRASMPSMIFNSNKSNTSKHDAVAKLTSIILKIGKNKLISMGPVLIINISSAFADVVPEVCIMETI